MKTKRTLFFIGLAFAISFAACTKDETNDPTCDGTDLSDDYNCPTNVDLVATFCSDGESNSYYTYNGKNYECTGVSYSTCDTALYNIGLAILAEGCGYAKMVDFPTIKIKLTKSAEELLNQVRLNSLSN